jgi:hypothetical protein
MDVIAGFRNSSLTTHIFDGSTSFYSFQNGNDPVPDESDLTHSDLLR